MKCIAYNGGYKYQLKEILLRFFRHQLFIFGL